MSTERAQARLHRALSIQYEALGLARTRTAEAADAAGRFDGLIEQQLLNMYHALLSQLEAVDELLAELQNPAQGD